MNKSNKRKVIAILSADYHLSRKPPVWRSNEPNWYAAMQRPLDEIQTLSEKYICPILCAGDIFDKWNSPPELINWALGHLPSVLYAIPGQHDIPNHNIEEMEKSAYRTLEKSSRAQTIKVLEIPSHKIKVYGFPFGSKIIGCKDKNKNWIHIAIIHKYLWSGSSKYQGASGKDNIRRFTNVLQTYDVVVVGDNHISFREII